MKVFLFHRDESGTLYLILARTLNQALKAAVKNSPGTYAYRGESSVVPEKGKWAPIAILEDGEGSNLTCDVTMIPMLPRRDKP